MIHSSSPIEAPSRSRMVGRAVVTTRMSSPTISDATDVSASTQRGLVCTVPSRSGPGPRSGAFTGTYRRAAGNSSVRRERREEEIVPVRIDVPDADLAGLRDRLRRTRWPDRETVGDWSQGAPLGWVQELCRYWASGYDWRARETRLNRFPQFRTAVDGLGLHFLHVRSPEA